MALHKSISVFSLLATCLLLLYSGLAEAEFGRRAPGRDRFNHRALPQISNAQRFSAHRKRAVNGSACIENKPTEIEAPKKNVWRQLSANETSSVTHWLHQQEDLNLKRGYSARGNTLINVELQIPNKTDVLAYIDGSGPEPARYAKVLIGKTSPESSTYNYLLAGPLPISSQTTWQPLTYPFTSKTGITRDTYWHYEELYKITSKIENSVKNITRHLWPGANQTYTLGSEPLGQSKDGKRLSSWSTYWNADPGATSYANIYDISTLLPLNLHYGIEWSYSDPSDYTFLGWLYEDISYPTTEAFQQAYRDGKIKPSVPSIAGSWAHSGQQGEVLPLDGRPPPQAVAPAGARFSWDKDAKLISWMGFTFYMAWTANRGWAFYDIRHKGQRIIYELSFQEALAHYAGTDPAQSTTSYLDAAYSLGSDAVELIPGYDCPAYATFMDTDIGNDGGKPVPSKNSVCFFEFDEDYPMARHTNYVYYSNTKNIKFVVRSVYTVGNYDYMFSYEFYLDGSIQVQVRASGYIRGQHYLGNEEYGYRIHDALSGSMHDHTLNFKADFDIVDTANTAQLTTFVPANEKYVWSPQPRQTFKLQREFVESEDNSRLIWNRATQYRIVNTDKCNKYGEYRGYRILPSDGTTHFTNNQSSNLANLVYPFTFDMAITKQKDTEPLSTDPNNENDIWNPLVNFNNFFDGESLMQEDLVVWLNLGMHHLPHTGDIPNTVFTTAHAGITMMPLNYYNRDISTETLSQVEVRFQVGNVTKVKSFGQQEAVCSVDLSKEAPDLYQLGGEYGYY